MGRRSTKTTKTGKFMNPTDQWRKQCRKKELKKNKVQRTAVREAVIKSKNPQQLLAEIEEIEKMEIEAGTEELPNDKGLKEKKRKLHETLQRIVNFYEREDYNKAQQIKTFIVESEKRRRDMTTVYSSYRTARSQYDVSDIPLPEGPGLDDEEGNDIPLPEEPFSIVRQPLMPPGPPLGPPPDVNYPKAVTLLPKKVVHFGEGDGKEDDNESNDAESTDGSYSDSNDDDDQDSDEEGDDHDVTDSMQSQRIISQRPGHPPGPPPGLPPPGIHYPPPLFPPPPQPTAVGRFPVIPTAPLRPLIAPSTNKSSPHFQSSAVISASPKTDGQQQQTATISAQPQIRNVQAEVTKFLPTSLRVRRDIPRQVKPSVRPMDRNTKPKAPSDGAGSSSSTGVLAKGDAYEAFMKEMQGLI